jgi:hypothetical protein
MNDDMKDRDGDEVEGGPPSGLKGVVSLLDKIRATLANTAAERWEQGGEPLDTSRRFPRS